MVEKAQRIGDISKAVADFLGLRMRELGLEFLQAGLGVAYQHGCNSPCFEKRGCDYFSDSASSSGNDDDFSGSR